MNRIKKLFKSTSSVNGSYSVGVIALVIIVVILVNLIASKLPDSLKNIDISDQKIYGITSTSKEVLKNLDKKVTFTVYAQKSETDDRIKNFIKKYTALSDEISVEWVDPVLHPAELTENNVSSNTILIACKDTGKQKAVTFDQIIVSEYTSYYSDEATETAFDGEGQFTSAINYVISEQSTKVYVTTGHGESDLSDSASTLLDKNNMEVDSVNLIMTNEIPDDCDLLLMSGVTTDLSKDEVTLLKNYMGNGGKVMLVLGDITSDVPNLDGFLEDFGMERVDGYIADLERCYQGNYYYIFPEITDSSLTDGMSSEMVLMADAHGMTLTDSQDESISVTPFMETSSNAYAVTESGEQKQGQYVLGAYADVTYEKSSDDEAKDTDNETADDTTDTSEDESSDSSEDSSVSARLTVITSDSMLNSQITDAFSTLENLQLFINAASANFDDVDNVAIPSKSLEVTYNTMQHGGLFGFLVIFVLPLIILVYGFSRWWRRRKS